MKFEKIYNLWNMNILHWQSFDIQFWLHHVYYLSAFYIIIYNHSKVTYNYYNICDNINEHYVLYIF